MKAIDSDTDFIPDLDELAIRLGVEGKEQRPNPAIAHFEMKGRSGKWYPVVDIWTAILDRCEVFRSL